MAKICQKCGRGTKTKVSRSYSNIATKKRQYVNLQTRVIGGKKMRVCTRCSKAEFKQKNN